VLPKSPPPVLFWVFPNKPPPVEALVFPNKLPPKKMNKKEKFYFEGSICMYIICSVLILKLPTIIQI
jgi:hypothetical protein